MADSRPLCHSNYHIDWKFSLPGEWLKAVSPRVLSNGCAWMCLDFPGVTDAWPFQDYTATQTITLTQSFASQETWSLNVQSKGFPSITYEWSFQIHLATQAIMYQLKALSPGRPQQWICTAKAPQVWLTDGLFKTILLPTLSYWLEALSLCRMAQSCLPGDLKSECTELILPQGYQWTVFSRASCHSNNCINLKLCLPAEQLKAMSPGDLNNECTEPRLP